MKCLESVVKVPETTFNNMHGKLNHIKTEDAQKYADNCPNALGNTKCTYEIFYDILIQFQGINTLL